MLNNKSIRFKLTVFILTGVIFIVLGLFSYYYFVSSKLLLKTALENAQHLTNETINKVENVFLASAKIPKNLAFVLENTTISDQEMIKFQEVVVRENDEIFASAIAFEPGEYKKNIKRYAPFFFKEDSLISFQNLDSGEYNYFLQDWYQIPKELNRAYWSEPYYDEGGGDILMSTYSVPFHRKDSDKLRGIITIDISLEWLQKIFQQLKIYESGYGFLLSQSGRYIVHPNEDLVMNASIFDIAESRNDSLLREAGRKMLRGEQSIVEISSPGTKEKFWLYYAPLLSNGYTMGIVIPQKEFYADLYQLNKTVFFSGIAGLIFLFAVISVISKKITLPLRNLSEATKVIGQGDFSVKLPQLTTGDEIGILSRSFEKMQITLKEYIENLKSATAEKERIQGELRIAHDIQMSIIPKTFPPFPNRNDVDIFGVLEPAKAVGGDLYDFFLLDDDHLCAAIGDVSGKGVPASLFMAVTRTLLRAKANKTMQLSIDEIITGMNIDLCSENEASMFVTFFLTIINLKTGEMKYCNAGHNFPYILHADGKLTELNQTHGLPLGVMDLSPYSFDKIQLEKGARLFLFTDGINEAENMEKELFDDRRLRQTLGSMGKEPSPRVIIETMRSRVKKFTGEAEQSDDLTMLSIKYKGNYAEKSTN
jgi:sigma-B regulation protein RsbU (phosphoserine phosphatase)